MGGVKTVSRFLSILCVRAILSVALIASVWSPVWGKTIYVSPLGAGFGDGTSWVTPFANLQQALDAAVSGDEIWCAQGVYLPGTNRTASFHLDDGVAVFGGFLGGETERSQRDPNANPTVLEGDIGVPFDFSDNVYHVVRVVNAGPTCVLDGFVIQNGNANQTSFDSGGGFFASESSPTVRNCAFIENRAAFSGGGFRQESGNGSPVSLVNCRFIRNSGGPGGFGGGLSVMDDPVNLTNCLFLGNGGVERGGGAYIQQNTMAVNCTFCGNQVTPGALGQGGGLFVNGQGSVITNSIFWENFADGGSPELFAPMPIVRSCDIRGGGFPGPGNFSRDPLFDGLLDGHCRLSPGSPCIDSGTSTGLPFDFEDLDEDGTVTELLPFDLDRNLRIAADFNSNELGPAPIVDRGAFEFQPPFLQTPLGFRGAASAQTVRLVWIPSAEPYLAGYNIFRATDFNGPFDVPLNGDSLIREPFYLDTEPPASPSQGVFYQAEARSITRAASLRTQTILVQPGSFSFEIGDRNAAPGDQNVAVPFTTLNARGLNGNDVLAQVRFPDDLLTLKGIERAALTRDSDLSIVSAAGGSDVVFFTIQGKISEGEGALANLIFDVTPTAPIGGEAALTIESVTLTSNLATLIGKAGKLRIEDSIVLGNVDRVFPGVSDTDVELARRAALLEAPLKPDVYPAGDINDDGVIDIADVTLIQRIRDGLSIYPPSGKRREGKGETAAYSIQATTGFFEVNGTTTELSVDLGFPFSVKGPANPTGIAALGLTLLYNPDLVDLVSVEPTALAAGFEFSLPAMNYFRIIQPGVLRVGLAAPTNLPPVNGAWLKLRFHDISAPPAVLGTESPILFASAKIATQFGEDLSWDNTVLPLDGNLIYGPIVSCTTPACLLDLLEEFRTDAAVPNDLFEFGSRWLE
jgi:hypothetical protein